MHDQGSRQTTSEDRPQTAPNRPVPRHWRSLEELAGDSQTADQASPEFLPGVAEIGDSTHRRAFLQRVGATLGFAGASGCLRQPLEEIVPRVTEPEHFVPGHPTSFATAMPVPGGAIGLLVESHDGRPTKVEGNPLHPSSLGATDAIAQASVHGLYEPSRSQVVLQEEAISNWPTFLSSVQPRLATHREKHGSGLHLLLGRTTSPTLLRQLGQLLDELPEARWYEHEPMSDLQSRRGAELAFGAVKIPRLHLDQADVVLSIDADMLSGGPAGVRLAHEFASRRRVPASGRGTMNRLYAVESTPTLTGAAADHRAPVAPTHISAWLRAIAIGLGLEIGEWPSGRSEEIQVDRKWIDTVCSDLAAAGSRALVVAGATSPADVQAVALALNAHLRAVGTTITLADPMDRPEGHEPHTIGELAQALSTGDVETLLILGPNPVYDAPADLRFADALQLAEVAIHYGLDVDETAQRCHWHVPGTHYLESWSDVGGEDGTASIIQPLIAPLYNGRSPHEMLNVLLGEEDRSAYDTIRDFWRAELGSEDFESRWRRSLHDGLIADTAVATREASIRDDFVVRLKDARPAWEPTRSQPESLHILFRAAPFLADGRFATNDWLQELPQPFTKLTWGNAALISPATARSLELTTGDMVQLACEQDTIETPVCVLPGQPDDVVTLHLGYGRPTVRRSGQTAGVDVFPLRTSREPWRTHGRLLRTGRRTELAITQHHHLMEGRDLIRAGTFAAFQASPIAPPFMQPEDGKRPGDVSLYPDREEHGPQWGMTIDLTACIGCSACVIACQAENNIPVVGPEQVRRGREMHWLRIDTYYSDTPDNPLVHHQPVLCMHCEHAPCEPVCPVAATTHSDEGLNEMTYNRCVGTRYCSNNCPYKVRRFNFLDFREDVKELPVLQLQQNPDVTVRSRGVMEKCTYCIQRINAARIQANMEDRPIHDGEIVTACQGACPFSAITFGDIRDQTSSVARQKSHPLNYGLLEELNTRPRTTYLASIRNPHPALAVGDDRDLSHA